jgi:hypothetical protein
VWEGAGGKRRVEWRVEWRVESGEWSGEGRWRRVGGERLSTVCCPQTRAQADHDHVRLWRGITTTVTASGSLGAAQPRRLLCLSTHTRRLHRHGHRHVHQHVPHAHSSPRPAFPAQPPPAFRYRHQYHDQDTPRHLTLSGAVAYSRPSHPPNSKHVDSSLCFHAMAHDSALVHAVPCITRASVQTKLTHYHMFALLILNTDLSVLGLAPPALGLASPVRLVSVSPIYSHLMQLHACTRLHSPS